MSIGVRAFWIEVIIRLNGTGGAGNANIRMRVPGETSDTGGQNEIARADRTNLGSGIELAAGAIYTVMCDRGGSVEYRVNAAGSEAFVSIYGDHL